MRVLLALVVLLGCEGAKDALQRRRDPGTLVVAQAAGPQKLDPIRVTDNESIEIGGLLFEGLVRWRPGTTDIVKGLAEEWHVSDDKRQWTFKLRRFVTFHDGTRLDATAVVFSFERLLDASHPHYVDADGAYWRSLLKSIKKVRAIDARTVQIEVATPYAPLLGDLVMFPIVSPAAVRQWGDAFMAHPVGTGPFMFESWTPGEHVVVRRNEQYWDRPAVLERIVFRVIVDARQRLVELESGAVDLATGILPDEQSFVDLHPDLVLHHMPGNDVSYLAFNLQRAGFRDLRVRRAVSHAINKDPIVKLAFQGRAVAAETPLPPMQWGHHLPKRRYGFDKALARKLLDEAAAEGAFDLEATYTLYAPSTPRVYMSQPDRVARYLQSALEQVGIRTELVMQPYNQHRRSLENGEHDLALFGWVGDNGDPDNFLYVLFHSENARGGQSTQNFAFYRDAAVDKRLRDAQVAVDDATRTTHYHAVQDQLAEDVPWVPLVHSEYVVAGRTEIQHVTLSPLGHPIYAAIGRRTP
jgi:peptide/nickel transport system substrate-binding protein